MTGSTVRRTAVPLSKSNTSCKGNSPYMLNVVVTDNLYISPKTFGLENMYNVRHRAGLHVIQDMKY